MFIQSVRIKGIRSYKNEIFVQDFSESCSIVVGRNGSGKSNFFLALGLIFNPKYRTLSKKERCFFLSNSGGSEKSKREGFVEIVIDNSDLRFPTINPTSSSVTIRRDITAIIDQFRVDGEKSTKDQLKSMLESAGFSSRNPYFVVPQGQINEIAMQNPEKHLWWLREMSGMSLYEERDKEGHNMHDKLEKDIEQGKWKINFCEQKLAELSVDMEKFHNFNKFKTKIEAITFALCKISLKACRREDDEIKELLDIATDKAQSCLIENNKKSADCKSLKERHSLLDNECAMKNSELVLLTDECSALLKKEAKLKMTMDDLCKQIADYLDTSDDVLNAELTNGRNELEKRSQLIENLKIEQRASANRIKVLEEDRNNLCKKSVFLRDFQSIDERDKHIQSEIGDLTEKKNETQAAIDSKKSLLQQDNQAKQSLLQILKEKEADFVEFSGKFTKHKEDLGKKKVMQLQLINEKRNCERELDVILQKLSTAKKESIDLKRSVYPFRFLSMYDDLTGIIEKCFTEDERENFKGMVLENIRCPEQIRTAVEVVAGARLFNLVVTNDDFALRIIDAWNREHRKGRLNFIALNKFVNGNRPEPPRNINDAMPLIDMFDLNENDFMENALNHMFGSTLLCRSVDVCTELSGQLKLDCVTLDGDLVSARGVISGGNRSHKLPVLTNYVKLRENRKVISSLKAECCNVTSRKTDIEVNLNNISGEISDLSKNKEKTRQALQVNGEIQSLKSELNSKNSGIEQTEELINKMKEDLRQITSKLQFLDSELGKPPNTELSEEEKLQLGDLGERLNSAKRNHSSLLEKRKTLELEKISLERSTIPQLQNRIEQHAEANKMKIDIQRKISVCQSELDSMTNALKLIEHNIDVAKQELNNKMEEKETLENNLNAEMGNESRLNSRLLNFERKRDKYAQQSKRSSNRLKAAHEKMIATTTPSSQLIAKYSGSSFEELYEIRGRLEQRMGAIGDINISAHKHYEDAVAQLAQLIDNQQKLIEDREETVSLLATNQSESDTAIRTTYSQVKSHFERIFTELVPRGKASMNFINDQDLDDNCFSAENIDICRITGICIKATFDTESNYGELQAIELLSGGQKTLVALSLLFALQCSDPTPFYIFDEVDQHLDEANVDALADFIFRKCEKSQMIMTTFRERMLRAAQSFFEVSCVNRASIMTRITRERATDVLNGEVSQ